MLADVSIVSISFLVGLAVCTVAVIVVVVLARHRLGRVGGVLGSILMVVLLAVNAAGWVNRHFDYLPTLEELFGQRASDQASTQEVKDQTAVPSKGRVIQIAIPGPKSGFNARSAQVYLPPAWFAKPRPQLGVIVLLAGTPGTPEDWTRGGAADVTSDAYAATHNGRAPLLVMADQNGSVTADTECVGASETYLTEDIPAFVVKRFSMSADPKAWAIGGLSEGGSCGLMIALRNPDIYPTFIDYSGLLGPRSGDDNSVGSTVNDLFGGSQSAFGAHEPLDILKGATFAGLAGWFEVGSADPAPLQAQDELAPAARGAGIAICAVEVPGGEHTFQLWSEAFENSLPWLAARLTGAPEVPCPDA